MVVFGGRAAAGDLNDVWAFDLGSGTWTEITPGSGPAPSPRFTHNAVYDPGNHRMIVWSGREVNAGGSSFFNDVWAFDLESGSWAWFDPPEPRPNVRYGTASVFDPARQHLVTFAGFTDEGRFEDTWRFDPASTSWIQVYPGTVPGRRCLHAAAYGHTNHQMIMYGGQRSGPLDDIWSLDLEGDTWSDLTPEMRPEGRFFATLVYDARSDCAVLFGGNRGGEDRTNEVWAFNLEARAWRELVLAGAAPPARDRAAAIYVESEDRMVVFGGTGEGQLNDVWSLNQLSRATSTAIAGGMGAGAPAALRLAQNWPNPFNGATAIRFSLPESGKVELAIYNLTGQKVATLVRATLPARAHVVRWDGRDRSGQKLASGAYLYQLQAGAQTETRKLVLVR